MLSQTAVMPSGTASQTTQYVYGASTSSGGSSINSNDLLVAIQYPSPSTGYAMATPADTYAYDALGEVSSHTDRNGTRHVYGIDAMGRMTGDQVYSLGSGVNGGTLALQYTYDDAGRLSDIAKKN